MEKSDFYKKFLNLYMYFNIFLLSYLSYCGDIG